ncbi:MAG: hypothetical protein CSYNP_00300 [Syntrophus sp. SKADARSKE-3]|nr:hypothetical protein [Syntrophus sp. SKADARSKE-3]
MDQISTAYGKVIIYGCAVLLSISVALPCQSFAQDNEYLGFTVKMAVRDFALFSYARLSNDIVNGGGRYLDTLYSLLGVKEKDRNNVRQDFVRIMVRNQRIPAFAMEIAEYGHGK